MTPDKISQDTLEALTKHIASSFILHTNGSLDLNTHTELEEVVTAAIADDGSLGALHEDDRYTIITKIADEYLYEGSLAAGVACYRPLGIFPREQIIAAGNHLASPAIGQDIIRAYGYFEAADDQEGIIKVADAHFAKGNRKKGHAIYASIGARPPEETLIKEANSWIESAVNLARRIDRHNILNRQTNFRQVGDVLLKTCENTIDYCTTWGFNHLLVAVGDSIIKNQPERYVMGDERYENIIETAKRCYTLSGNEHVAKTI